MSKKKYLESFFEESSELLQRLETSLLDLKQQPDNPELINTVFRILHTIKGTGAMFGFERLASFAHNIEAVFDQVRKNCINLNDDLLQISLDACDFMSLVIADKSDPAELSDREERLSIAFVGLLTGKILTEKAGPSYSEPENLLVKNSDGAETHNKSRLWLIRFAPSPGFYRTGNDPIAILTELDGLGKADMLVDLSKLPDLSEMIPTDCYLAWDILLDTTVSRNAIHDVFIFAEGSCELKVLEVDEPPEWFKEKSASISQTASVAQKKVKTENSGLVMENTRPGADIQLNNVVAPAGHGSCIDTSVDTIKVDKLIGLLGELVAIQARLSQVAELRADTELTTISRELEALTGELRENTLKISMLPISSVFGMLEERVHALAGNNGCTVQVRFNGGDTEFDKGALEKLLQPLFQLLECVVDNIGRLQKKSGQPAMAGLDIGAWQASGFLYVRIGSEIARFEDSDTGMCWLQDMKLQNVPNFVNFDSASESQTADAGQDLFKTRTQKFKNAIIDLRGSVSVVSSAARGLEITLKLPLNLAIIAGLMVKIEDGLFLIPLALVEECIELTRELRERACQRNLVMVRGSLVPYLNLRESFGISGCPPDIQQIVITVVENYRIGMVVDQVVGEYQTVIKKWGSFCGDVPGIAGATILGDGAVALIIDLPKLINEERHKFDVNGGEY
ncbi:MAG: hypothetical protein A2W80_05110 [Candidatus Riflebacteria bacterium GWC2_50_8]|nr:MAG: hypothetical protein A2W80_05110 [Candidatus Riflebacteria bacterium GWC2_50_8]